MTNNPWQVKLFTVVTTIIVVLIVIVLAARAWAGV